MNPKVSIVIPVYNGSKYLAEAIDSALAQTYNNIEILVINDGSNDDGATERIAKSYGDKIRYFTKKNGGVATALNLGIKNMSGEYFSWLSHDDLYYPDKIEKQVKFLSTLDNKEVFLYSNYSVLRDGKIVPVIHNHEMLVRKGKYSLLRGCVNGITVFIPKKILENTGEFNPELRVTQDYDYWSRMQDKYQFIHMTDVLSITRLHSEQDSVVSPRVVSEGNILWISMIKSLSDKEKVKYENTIYNFFYEMAKFLETTPYNGALEYCRKKITKLNQADSDLLKSQPKVSVIIPFYNHIDKTVVAIKSVLKQTYKNIEIILVDDCSSDNISKLEDLTKNKQNIRLVKTPKNSGPALSRNIGMDAATGEYVAFLDSDDEFYDNKIEKQLVAMLRYNPTASYTTYLRHKGNEDVLVRNPLLTGILVPNIISNCNIGTPTVMINRDFLENNRLRFNQNIRIGEDTCFWLEIAKLTEILLIDEPLTRVNVDDETHAINKSKTSKGIKNIINYLINDNYYSGYDNEIAVLCEYFSKINKDIVTQENDRTKFRNYESADSLPEPVLELFSRIKLSLPYRVVRKLYREGPKGVAKSVATKLWKD